MVDTAGIVTKPTDRAMNTITMLISITIQVVHTNPRKLTHTQNSATKRHQQEHKYIHSGKELLWIAFTYRGVNT